MAGGTAVETDHPLHVGFRADFGQTGGSVFGEHNYVGVLGILALLLQRFGTDGLADFVEVDQQELACHRTAAASAARRAEWRDVFGFHFVQELLSPARVVLLVVEFVVTLLKVSCLHDEHVCPLHTAFDLLATLPFLVHELALSSNLLDHPL